MLVANPAPSCDTAKAAKAPLEWPKLPQLAVQIRIGCIDPCHRRHNPVYRPALARSLDRRARQASFARCACFIRRAQGFIGLWPRLFSCCWRLQGQRCSPREDEAWMMCWRPHALHRRSQKLASEACRGGVRLVFAVRPWAVCCCRGRRTLEPILFEATDGQRPRQLSLESIQRLTAPSGATGQLLRRLTTRG